MTLDADKVRRYAKGVDQEKVTDEDINEFILDATAKVQQYTRKDFQEHPLVDVYQDADGRCILILENYPVITVTKLEVRQSDDSWLELTVFDPGTNQGSWRLRDAGAGLLEFIKDTPSCGTANVRLSYTWGWSEMPRDVETLIVIIAAISTLSKAAGAVMPEGLTSISEGALSLSWSGGGPYESTMAALQAEADKLIASIGRDPIIVRSDE